LENELLDHAFRNATFTSPTTVYLGLTTSTPTDSTGGTEISGNGYARQAITFGAASGGAIANTVAITFPEATGNQGTATHVEIWDSLTTGNRLAWGPLSSSQAINSGTVFEIPIGDLDVTLA